MHRYFLFFEIGFVAIMGYYYGWVAAGVSLAFVVLSAIYNLSREEEKKVEEVKRRYEFERKTMESCQKIYKDILTDEDLDAVRKLGVLIQLASAMDKSRMGNITDITCDILGDSIIMKTIVKSDACFDVMQAQKVRSDFKRVFKKTLQVI